MRRAENDGGDTVVDTNRFVEPQADSLFLRERVLGIDVLVRIDSEACFNHLSLS